MLGSWKSLLENAIELGHSVRPTLIWSNLEGLECGGLAPKGLKTPRRFEGNFFSLLCPTWMK